MMNIEKHYVMDEQNQPVGVLIPYRVWLEIEKGLSAGEISATTQESVEDLRGSWPRNAVDGVEYQRMVRNEWG